MNLDKIYIDTLTFYFKFLSSEPMIIKQYIYILCNNELCCKMINNIHNVVVSGFNDKKITNISMIIVNEYLLSIFNYYRIRNNINSTHEKEFNELFPIHIKLKNTLINVYSQMLDLWLDIIDDFASYYNLNKFNNITNKLTE